MNPHTRWLRPIAGSVALGVLLNACASGAEEATPTFAVEQIQTEAVATFSADLTATAQAMPTETPTPTATPTPIPTLEPAVTPTGPATVAPTLAPATCEGLAFVSDVTIPDNTTLTPGQKFTKTWRVRNSGTCAWQTSFKLNFTGGEAMGGSSVSLTSAVQPGNNFDISVALTAPSKAGSYRGNWRMTNAGGRFFGDEVYVLIVVGGSTATPTGQASATPTTASTAAPTATPTQVPPTATPTLTPTETETSG